MPTIRTLLGVELDEVSPREKAVSVAGAGLSIALILVVTRHVLHLEGAEMLVASMGASAVLLFAVPHGALSQPWPLVASHLVAAVVGVTCSRFIGSTELASACAVGVSVGLMHQFGFIHPPGGATALTAVVGGPAIHSLGYGFVLRPVAVDVGIILAVAVLFNFPFPWRRYPAALVRRRPAGAIPALDHGEVLRALRSLDSFIDVTEDDLNQLVRALATPTPSGDDPVR